MFTTAPEVEVDKLSSLSEERKYAAFLSYSQRDGSWGRWVHRKLEQYRIPKHLRPALGASLPKRIAPVFRDRAELAASSSLSDEIRRALAQSRCLVVICSPSAARSRWVNEEIRLFRTLAPDRPIFPFITSGEPYASECGRDASDECIPEALREEGRPDADGRSGVGVRSEPLAADARREADGPRDALLKLVAGIIGVGFDDLKRRDQQRRVRLLTGYLTAALLLVGVLGFLLIQVEHERARAEKQYRTALSRQLAALSLTRIEGQLDLALLLAVQAWKLEPTREALGSLLTAVNHNPTLETFLWGSEDSVDSVAFTPDGKLIVAGGADRNVRMWNVENRRPSGRVLRGHTDRVWRVAISPDGRVLASAGFDGTVRLWRLPDGTPIGPVEPRLSGWVTSLAFSPSGQLAWGSRDGAIVVRDPKGPPSDFVSWRAHDADVVGLAFSPDGNTLVSASRDTTLRVWAPSSGAALVDLPLHAHSAPLTAVAFDPAGEVVASADQDHTIILWDTRSWVPIDPPLLEDTFVIHSLAFRPGTDTLASASNVRLLSLWDTTRHVLRRRLSGFVGDVGAVAFSPDGALLAGGDTSGAVAIWDLGDRNAQAIRAGGGVYSLSFDPTSSILAATVARDGVHLFDTATGEPRGVHLPGRNVSVVRFSPDGRSLAVADGDGSIWLNDDPHRFPGTFKLLGRHAKAVEGLAFHPDSTKLASGSADRTVELWDLTTGTSLGRLLTAHDCIWCGLTPLAFSPDGDTLAAGAGDGAIFLVQWVGGEHWVAEFPKEHEGGVRSLEFGPDGAFMISGGFDGKIVRWDVASRTVAGRSIKAHLGDVNGLAMSPDGTLVASGGNDHDVLLWDPVASLPIARLGGRHTKEVWTLAFSGDGRLLASSGGDGTIALWNVDRARALERACTVANRNLTLSEWHHLVDTMSAPQPGCQSPP